MDGDEGAGTRTTSSQAAWEARRHGAESRKVGGAVAAVGVFLCVLGIAVAIAKGVGPRHSPGADAALWILAFVVLGVLVLLAGRILDAIEVREGR